MQRLKVLVLALLAMFALAAVASAAASAAELPVFSPETSFTGTSGKGKLNLTGAEIKCEKGTNSGSPKSNKTGNFTIKFEKCSLGGKECHSEGQAEGSELIETTGEYKMVRLGVAKAGVLFEVTPVKIKCKFLSTKTEVKGNVLGGFKEVNEKNTKFEIPVNVKEGKQEIESFQNDEGVAESTSLLGSVNGGAFKSATEESAENKITTTVATEVKITT